MKAKSESMSRINSTAIQSKPVLNPNAAGLDIHGNTIRTAVPGDRDPEPTRVFAGDRDPIALAHLPDPHCHSTEAEIARALTSETKR